MTALAAFFTRRMPTELSGGSVNAQVKLLGSVEIGGKPLEGNLLGIYLHRITIDPHGRTRQFQSTGIESRARHAELPVNLHFLLLAYGKSAEIEADLMAWALVELANEPQIDISHLLGTDPEWGEREILTATPDEMSTEDLMRIWDVFETPYTTTVPFVARTVRLKLGRERTLGPDVTTRVFPVGAA